MRMIARLVTASVAVAIATISLPARSEPYEIYARYVSTKDANKVITIPITNGDMIPRDSPNYKMDGVFFNTKADDISKSVLANVRNFVLDVQCDSISCRQRGYRGGVHIGSVSSEPGKETPILRPKDYVSGEHTDQLRLVVRSKPTVEYLCTQEQAMRAARSKPDDQWRTAILPFIGPVDPSVAASTKSSPLTTIADGKLTQGQVDALLYYWRNGRPTAAPSAATNFFSFCSRFEKLVDWPAVSGLSAAGGHPANQPSQADVSDRGATARQKQKHQLSERLAEYLENDLQMGRARVGSDVPGGPENIYISAEHDFAVIRQLDAQLSFHEVDESGERDLDGVLDIDSELRLVLDKQFCSTLSMGCVELVNEYLSVSLDTLDDKGNVIRKVVDLEARGHQEWIVKANVSELYGQRITVSARYENDDQVFEMGQRTVRVENLGLVSTFPVLSELTALAAGGTNSKLELKSSIPLSFAYNASAADGRHAAITIPWMLGYNPRSAPHLSDYVKIFPHASLILPVSASADGGDSDEDDVPPDAGAQLAFGAGIALANAFTFAWGVEVDEGAHYLLVGISAPDLVKALNFAK